jgi:hypothetical protein
MLHVLDMHAVLVEPVYSLTVLFNIIFFRLLEFSYTDFELTKQEVVFYYHR